MPDGITLPEWPDPGADLPPRESGWRDCPPCLEMEEEGSVPEREGLWLVEWYDDGSAGVIEGPTPSLGPVQ